MSLKSIGATLDTIDSRLTSKILKPTKYTTSDTPMAKSKAWSA
ncbi:MULTISPECIES: hypothetical protein [Eikenella]|nr:MULTISPECIES: hypothetical protein [Eikenella]